MTFKAKDLMERGMDASTTHASDTGCLACELVALKRNKQYDDALRVLVLDDKTRAYLRENDPMALAQAYEALGFADTGD